MVVPHSYSHWVNLPFFAAEAFLSTACTRHFKMVHLTKKLNLVTRGCYLVHCNASTSMSYLLMTPTQQFYRILAVILDVASHLPGLNFESFLKLLIFLYHQCMDLPLRCCYMASSVFLFAKKLILLQHVFSGQI